MTTIEIRQRSVGPWPMNTYALICPTTRQSMLIDPGADIPALVDMLDGTTPQAILLTHAHGDHIGALDEMRERLRVPVMAHPGPHPGDIAIAVDRQLAQGDTLSLGEHTITVYATPGHTQDMVCFAAGTTIVVGDTIFAGGPGKTWSAPDFQTTLRTLRDVILAWPDDAVCYPGHGPAFRVGDKRQAIADFVDRPHGDFYGDASWDV